MVPNLCINSTSIALLIHGFVLVKNITVKSMQHGFYAIIYISLLQWEKLDMTPAERRKVVCSVTFHVIAITCVIWSLYVLIDRTTEEVEAGSLLWPFWTKLIVVAIGFTGGVVFMYVQCKMYYTLCKKWRTYNKVILVESISEEEREVANQAGLNKLKEKQKGLETGTDFEMFSVVNETNTVWNEGMGQGRVQTWGYF